MRLGDRIVGIACAGDVVFVECDHKMSVEHRKLTQDHLSAALANTGVKVVLLDGGMKVARVEQKNPIPQPTNQDGSPFRRPEPPEGTLMCECGKVPPAKCLLCRFFGLFGKRPS